ncbi:MAG: flagellar hook-basal body complex protein FliE [Methyloligellaceae bacterium]
MPVNPSAALGAYANATRLGNETTKTAGGLGQSGGGGQGSFANLVSQALEDVSSTGQAAEAKAMAIASGKAEMVDLVTAVAETEVAMETLVTVRDRVISAYQDIINMPI